MLFDLIVSHHYVSSFKHLVDLLCGKAFSGGVFGNKQFSLNRVFLQLHEYYHISSNKRPRRVSSLYGAALIGRWR